MELASGNRTATASITITMLGGLTLILYGVGHSEPPHAIAGTTLAMVALTLTILTVVHRWITDTGTERACLAASQREAQAERTLYLAAQAAVENEQARLTRDLAAERAALAEQLKQERRTLAIEFEERKAALISETVETTFLMIRDGKFAADTPHAANLIHFPDQPARERSREHGVVGP